MGARPDMIVNLQATVLVGAVLLALPAPSGAACQWAWEGPLPTGHTLTAVASVDDALIAVGEHGTVAISTDGGLQWTVRSLTADDLHGIASNGTQVVAVGEGGLVASWTRDFGWRQQRVGEHDLWDVTVARGSWVAVGAAGTSIRSDDGQRWQTGTPAGRQPLYAVTLHSGQLVAVGGGGVVATSDDGLSWTMSDSEVAVPLFAVTSYDDQLVAAGLLGTTVTSHDGVTWFTVDVPTLSALRDLHTGPDGRLYAVSSDGAYVTSDAVFWEREPTGDATPRGLLGAVSSRDGLIAVGELGLISYRDRSGEWRQLSHGSTAWWSGFAASTRRAVLVGENPGGDGGVIAIAEPTGRIWQVAARLEHGVNDVVWTGSQFIAVGDHGTIWLSPDGLDWSPPETTPRRIAPLAAIVWTDRGAVAVGGGGTVLTSATGAEWVRQQLDVIGTLHDVAWNGDRLVAVGDNGTIISSDDGTSWQRHRSGTPVPLFAITIGSNGFVATGGTGVILTSTDGTVFSTILTDSTETLRSVTWNGTTYTAVGDWGTFLTSSDGQLWSATELPTDRTLQLVTDTGDGILVAGWYGAVLSDSCPRQQTRRIHSAAWTYLEP